MQVQKETSYINGFHYVIDALKYTKYNTQKRSNKNIKYKTYNDRNM